MALKEDFRYKKGEIKICSSEGKGMSKVQSREETDLSQNSVCHKS